MKNIIIMIIIGITGCSAITVEKLNQNDPSGLPFYLEKPMMKISKINYRFIDMKTWKEITSVNTEERTIENVLDKSSAYTVNQYRSFAGESKFDLERTNSYNVTKIGTENKEGITEFLKGLVEGTKTLTELAKEGAKASSGAPAGYDEGESGYFQKLAEKDVMVIKTTTSVLYQDI